MTSCTSVEIRAFLDQLPVNEPFCPLLTGAEGTVIFTGVTVLASGSTLLFTAFGLCLGAMDVSVGPTDSVILSRGNQTGDVPRSLVYVQQLNVRLRDFTVTWLLSGSSWQRPRWPSAAPGASWGWESSAEKRTRRTVFTRNRRWRLKPRGRIHSSDLRRDLALDSLFLLTWRQSRTLGKCLVSSPDLVRACILEETERETSFRDKETDLERDRHWTGVIVNVHRASLVTRWTVGQKRAVGQKDNN